MSEKFAFIDAEKARYPIAKMCVWLEASTSGYYEWRDRPLSATAQRRTRLATLIRAIFDESEGTYGYRRVHAALARQGEGCGLELVRDLMRELGLVACQPRPWRPTTTQAGEGGTAVADLVGRDFSAEAPGTKMVGDITYLPTCEGFAYLATVIDCCTPITCARNWSSTRCAWPPATTACNPERFFTPIEARSISAKRSPRSSISSTFVIQWVG